VRSLVDENLSRRLVTGLRLAGHDAVHVADLNLRSAPDADILEAATGQERIVISSDTDFGTLLAEMRAIAPSMILVRRLSNRRADELAALILANLRDVTDALEQGAVIVIEETRVRVRLLPLA
jgi:predicted nuclease of predicted toxin-antitoxin system